MDDISASKYPYPDGELPLQPFAPNNSTEGRLLMWRGAKLRNFDPIAYENYYFWLNNIVSEWGMFDHGIDTKLVDVRAMRMF